MKLKIMLTESEAFLKSIELYCLELIIEASLIEAIKRNEINSKQNAVLKILDESDTDRAARIMVFSKIERNNRKSLEFIRYNIHEHAALIAGYLANRRNKFVYYTLKRDEYIDKTFYFHISDSGILVHHQLTPI